MISEQFSLKSKGNKTFKIEGMVKQYKVLVEEAKLYPGALTKRQTNRRKPAFEHVQHKSHRRNIKLNNSQWWLSTAPYPGLSTKNNTFVGKGKDRSSSRHQGPQTVGRSAYGRRLIE